MSSRLAKALAYPSRWRSKRLGLTLPETSNANTRARSIALAAAEVAAESVTAPTSRAIRQERVRIQDPRFWSNSMTSLSGSIIQLDVITQPSLYCLIEQG